MAGFNIPPTHTGFGELAQAGTLHRRHTSWPNTNRGTYQAADSNRPDVYCCLRLQVNPLLVTWLHRHVLLQFPHLLQAHLHASLPQLLGIAPESGHWDCAWSHPLELGCQ